MIALAERFGFRRDFQPTMSHAADPGVPTQADRAAYTEAVSAYAGLGHDDLRAAALEVLNARTLIGSDPG